MTPDEYRKKCEWLAAFYKEAAKTGRQMQMRCEKWIDYDRGPNTQSHPDEWRIKPEPEKAWLVWGNNWVCALMTEQAAKNQARMSGGTIQEITRPEPK